MELITTSIYVLAGLATIIGTVYVIRKKKKTRNISHNKGVGNISHNKNVGDISHNEISGDISHNE